MPVIELAMKNFGIDLIHIDKKENYPQVISHLKSALNREKHNTQIDLMDGVINFNYATRLKIRRLLNK